MTKKKKLTLTVIAAAVALLVAGIAAIAVILDLGGSGETEPVQEETTIATDFFSTETDNGVVADNTEVTESSVDISADTVTSDADNTQTAAQTSEPSESQPQTAAATEKPQQTTVKPVAATGNLNAECSVASSWTDGASTCTQIDVSVKNSGSASASSWTVTMTVPNGAEISQSWNGKYSISGTTLTIKPDGYNAEIAANGSVSTGFIIKTSSAFKPSSVAVNGTAGTASGGNENNSANENNSGNQGGGDVVGNADVEAILERCDDAVQGDDWLHTDGSKIYDKSGKEVWLTGCNWFGYNTGTNLFDGVWNCNLENALASIADHGFNLLRIPFSAELINQWAAGMYPTANYNGALNPNLADKNSLEIFDYVVTLCEANGIKIMIDIHSAETNASGHTINLWYTNKISTAQYYSALEWMAARYKNNDTIIAYDLKNEPHGKEYEGNAAAIWNNSKSANNWKYVAETAAGKVLAKNPNVLIMVEGTEIYPKNPAKNNFTSTNAGDYYYNWWGGNLRGVADYPINLGKYQNKLVYSPHDYGPAVYAQPWFDGKYTYNSLMNDCWRDNWFYIYEQDIAPLLIGEWGGYMTEPNLTWMTYMRKLIKTYHLNHTFWCFNANSGDTGGLVLDDFTTWDTTKYNFVKEVLWQEGGKFVGLDHAIPLGQNGITLKEAKGL